MSDPQRAIVTLHDQFPDDPKVQVCIRFVESLGLPWDFSFPFLDGRTIDVRDCRALGV